jgi:hypothetical protein
MHWDDADSVYRCIYGCGKIDESPPKDKLVASDGGSTPEDVDIPPAKDSINTLVLAHDNGYVELEGPYAHTVDGWQWEVTLPLDEDDYGVLTAGERSVLKDAEGWIAIALADASVESYGHVAAVDELERKLHLTVEIPGRPQ